VAFVEEMGGGKPVWTRNGQGELSPRRFLVTGATETDPRVHPGIPAIGHEITFDGVTFRCLHVGVAETINDTLGNYIIEATYSSNLRFRFGEVARDRTDPAFNELSMSYEKTTIKIPEFSLQMQAVRNQDGSQSEAKRWVREEREMAHEYWVISITVNLLNITSGADKLKTINLAAAQANHWHVFPAWPERTWLMRSPTFREMSDARIEVAYTWVWDPGTPEFEFPPIAFPDDLIMAPARPQWHDYLVIPSRMFPGGTITPPQILTVNAVNTASAAYTPNGWETLPGSPI